MDITSAIDRFIQHRKDRNLAQSSIRLYLRLLTTWSEWRTKREYSSEMTTITLDEFDQFFSYLVNDHVPHGRNPHRPATNTRLKPESVAAYRRVLRAFWRFAASRRWLSPDQINFFDRDGVQTVYIPEVARPIYSEEEYASMLAACGDGNSEESARDRTLIALLWESGARISELLSVDDERVELRYRRARIVGKGRVERIIRWGPVGQSELLRYVPQRRGDRGAGPLFRATSTESGDNTRLSSDVARSRLKRLMEAADIQLIEGSPLHAFRRSFIQRGIDEGLDISEVSQLAGHHNIETTMRYARRDEEKLQEIYDSGYIRKERRKKQR